jgi:hypothetical protein
MVFGRKTLATHDERTVHRLEKIESDPESDPAMPRKKGSRDYRTRI